MFDLTEDTSHIELFEAYLEGRMLPEEKSAFEVRLLVEPELNEEFSNYRKIVDGLRELGSEKVREKLRIVDKELDGPKKNRLRPLWLWSTMGIAAILCMVFITNYLESESLIPLPHEQGLPVTMSALNEDVDFENAMQHFKFGELNEALAGFNSCLTRKPENDTLVYYMAVSQLMLKDYDQSVIGFQKVLVQDSSIFLKKSRYYLAYSFYQKSMFAEARKALQPLISDKNNPLTSETERFMQILNERED